MAFSTIGWRFYLIFILVPACGLPVIYYYFPETRGLTLEEVGGLFGDRVASSSTNSQRRGGMRGPTDEGDMIFASESNDGKSRAIMAENA